MHPDIAAFLSFLEPYFRSDEERAAYSQKAAARRHANMVSADEGGEVSAIERAAEWGSCLKHAEAGNARAARRVAELCELGDGGGAASARPWWRYAAALGDRDAQMYVEHIFGESAPATATEVADASGAADDVSER